MIKDQKMMLTLDDYRKHLSVLFKSHYNWAETPEEQKPNITVTEISKLRFYFNKVKKFITSIFKSNPKIPTNLVAHRSHSFKQAQSASSALYEHEWNVE